MTLNREGFLAIQVDYVIGDIQLGRLELQLHGSGTACALK